MKYAISFILILIASKWSCAQETDTWAALFSDQKQYVTTVISPQHRASYLAQIHLAYIVHAKVWAEIKKMYATVSLNDNWNIIEKFFPQGKLAGVLWTGSEGPFYQFTYAADQKLTITQNSLAQLSDTTGTIVSNFQNWEHPIFAIQGSQLVAPRTHPFYLGSRISGIARKIICFYYP